MSKTYHIPSKKLQETIVAAYGSGPYPDDIATEIKRFQDIVTTADEPQESTSGETEPQINSGEVPRGFLDRLIAEKVELGERLEALEKFLKNDDKHDFSDSKSFERLLEEGISNRQAEYLFDQRRQMRDLYRTLCLRIGDLIK